MSPIEFRAFPPSKTTDGLVQFYEAMHEAKQPLHFDVVSHSSQRMPEEDKLVSIGKGYDLDPFTVRQRLLLQAPRIWKRYTNQTKAQAWADWMSKLGVRCFVMSEETVRDYMIHSSRLVAQNESAIFVQTKEHSKIEIRLNEILVIVEGRIQLSEKIETHQKSVSGLELKPSKSETTRSESVRVFDLHLLGKRRAYRLEVPSTTAKDSNPVVEKILNNQAGIPVFNQFEFASPLYGEMLTIQTGATEALPKKKREGHLLNHRLETRQRFETNTTPLFDLYSVLSRYDFVGTDSQEEPSAQ